jgi:hypothetical protein
MNTHAVSEMWPPLFYTIFFISDLPANVFIFNDQNHNLRSSVNIKLQPIATILFISHALFYIFFQRVFNKSSNLSQTQTHETHKEKR